jgi:hypothetical protein
MRALVGTCFGSGSQLAAKSTSLRMSRHFSSCRPSPGLMWPNAMLSIASPGGDMPWPNATVPMLRCPLRCSIVRTFRD